MINLFGEKIIEHETNTSEWGTFRDSLKAPIHRWFTYPAGFSYKAVEYAIFKYQIKPGQIIYDPFMGSGTTNVVAKFLGINSYGIEAHPFVFEIAKTKLNWDISTKEAISFLEKIETYVKNWNRNKPRDLNEYLKNTYPQLVLKCFLEHTLFELTGIKKFITNNIPNESLKSFFKVALIRTLREVSIAATGWPYIAPDKVKITNKSKNGLNQFKESCFLMLSDIQECNKTRKKINSSHEILLANSAASKFETESADFIFTSPPYLNNYDYADRTRLEMYFMGEAKNWKEISKIVRTKLMTSTTTQITRKKDFPLDKNFIKDCPEVTDFLAKATSQLEDLRKTKGGKKSYDLLVRGYFNDMYKILKDNFRVLKPNSYALYILGDSAPYGVHIPTDELIGKIGIDIGFKEYSIQVLRSRGSKWKNNPQRHNVNLRESIVILKK
ncbi:MAG: hypothetical protein D6707_00160 [Bacteroidetes bacterium]|nr:MAG: hypothetical protein D6707_00160 [Bacteroidota bacterium]